VASTPPTEPGHVELRIHGVSGSPPEQVLGGDTKLVEGTGRTGFHRLRDGPDGPLEAYSWGGMTSGSRWSALWVLMLPFAVVNVAGWMTGRLAPARMAAHVIVVRTFGLLLTGAYALSAVAVFVDLGAYRRVWRMWWWPADPALRGLAGGVVALSLPVVTGLLAGRSRRRNEAAGVAEMTGRDPVREARLGGDPPLWNAPWTVEALGAAHLTFAIGVAASVLGYAGRALDGGGPSWLPQVAWAGGLVLVVGGVGLLVGYSLFPGRLAGVARLNRAPAWWLFVGAAGGASVAAMALSLPATVTVSAPALPGLTTAFGLTIGGLTIVWLIHVVATRRGGLGRRAPSSTFLVVGAGMLLSFAAGVARLLAGRRFPEAYLIDHLALAFAAVLVLEGLVALGVWLRAGRARTPDEVAEATSVVAPTWLPRLRRAATRVPVLYPVAALAPPLWLMALPVLATACPEDTPFPVVFRCPAVPVVGPIAFPGTTGGPVYDAAAIVAVAGPALALLLYVLRGPGSLRLRRRVGIVWDLATFWPRWYHPWGPPPYPETAVADLAGRIDLLAATRPVVVSGHSQGSVLALPAILAASPADLAFVSHGSPLRRFYADLFPAHVDADLLDRIASTCRRGWANLYRATDPIGAPIGHPRVEDVLVGEPLPDGRVGGHSRYEAAPEYGTVIAAALRPIGPPPQPERPPGAGG
jgi:hypothetical protein